MTPIRRNFRRRFNAAHRFARSWKMALWGLADRHHVLLAQVIPTRRCNLACRYCNEFDQVSDPVPTVPRRHDINAAHH